MNYKISSATKKIPETLIIPDDSLERFITFVNAADGQWGDNGIILAGISDLTAGYQVVRYRCGHHFLGFCLDGEMAFESDEFHGQLRKNRVLFLPAGTLHRYQAEAPFRMVWFHIDPRHPRWQFLSARSAFAQLSNYSHEIEELFEKLYGETQHPLVTKDRVIELLCALILAYLEREFALNETVAEYETKQTLKRVWRVVSDDLTRGWTVAKLAKLAAMSPSHFHFTVMAHYRNSPMVIVRNLRLDRAKNLLLNTHYKLDHIADMTGYGNAYSFARAFKQVVGVAPGAFKKQKI